MIDTDDAIVFNWAMGGEEYGDLSMELEVNENDERILIFAPQ